jgi:hypothetical protein
MKRALFIASLSWGCSDQGLKPCHDEIDVGITSPSHNSSMAEGFTFELDANVQNLCGGAVLEEAMYSISSDADGALAGSGSYADGVFSFTGSDALSLGRHELNLRVVGSGGTDADDTITVEVVENTAPVVTLTQPGEDIMTAGLEEGVVIMAEVYDEYEDLDSLVLEWSIDGVALIEGPEFADADGTVSFSLTSAQQGCQQIEVTVTDLMGQSGNDTGDLLIYDSLDEIDEYRWWVDSDGDGWGVEDTEVLACEAPKDSVGFGTAQDCDDTDESVHPGAADYCDDGVDSDCDSSTPAGCFPLGHVDASISGAYMSGGFYDVAGVGDVNDDGYDDIAVGMSDQQAHIILGPVLGSLSADYSLISDLPSGDLSSFRGTLGGSLDGGLDVNGDGISDLILGNPGWSYACSGNYTVTTGKAYMLMGGELPSGELDDMAADGEYVESGEAMIFYNDYTSGCGYVLSNVGSDVALVPDMDGDGLADFVISAVVDGGSSAGGVWIMLSSDLADMESGLLDSNPYRVHLMGAEEGDELGTAVASADVDGDGLSDLLVSAAPDGSPGTVYVVYARDLPISSSDIDIRSIASLSFTGIGENSRAGFDIAGVGDLDGDGDDEFLISAPNSRDGDGDLQPGQVYLVPGFYEVNGTYGLGDEFSSSTTPNALGAVLFTGESHDALRSVAAGGDINNDGEMDLLIGAPGHSAENSEAGALYILYGGEDQWGDWWDPATGEPHEDIQLYDAADEQNSTARIYSTTADDAMGTQVDAAGDMNGDGIDDVVVSPGAAGGTLRIFFGGGT